jgi:hypothetical protein
MKKYYFLLTLFVTVFNVSVAENTNAELASLKETMNHAIIKVEQTQKQLWSYEVSRYENEEGDISSSIEQHSPQSNEPWLLKKINGKSPSQKQMKNFVKKNKNKAKPSSKKIIYNCLYVS